MSLLTMGLIFLAFALILVAVYVLKLGSIRGNILYVMWACAAVSLIALCFCIYASCCGGKCAHGTLAVILTVFLVICAALIYFAFRLKDQAGDLVKEAWEQSSDETRDGLQEVFKCCGYDVLNASCASKYNETCKDKATDGFKKYSSIAGYVVIALTVLLLLAVVLSWHYACCHEDQDDKVLVYGDY